MLMAASRQRGGTGRGHGSTARATPTSPTRFSTSSSAYRQRHGWRGGGTGPRPGLSGAPPPNKPAAFLDVVERVPPAPGRELSARRDRLGWDTWGNESLGTANLVV